MQTKKSESKDSDLCYHRATEDFAVRRDACKWSAAQLRKMEFVKWITFLSFPVGKYICHNQSSRLL